MNDPLTGDVGRKFADLLSLMATLRSDEGCPWDREQTHGSLKRYLIEEAYELLEALDAGDDDAIAEELGDVLLQVIFHAQIASETGRFTMADVVDALHDKLVRRHPHVFGIGEADDAQAVLRTWNEMKRSERTTTGETTADAPPSILASIPKSMPSLMEAEKVQARAAQVGFEWDDIAGAWEKVTEELAELQHAARQLDNAQSPTDETSKRSLRAAVSGELGDVLFAVVNVARYLGVDPEQSLRATNAKFRSRFAFVEEGARTEGRRLEDMSLTEMDAFWEEAKQQRRGHSPP